MQAERREERYTFFEKFRKTVDSGKKILYTMARKGPPQGAKIVKF